MSYELQISSFLSGGTLDRAKDHNKAHGAWQADKAELIGLRSSILNAAPLTVDPATLASSRIKLTSGYLLLLQREAKLAEDTIARLDEIRTEAEKASSEAHSRSQSVLQKMMGNLKLIFGSLPEPQLEAKAKISDECVAARQQVSEISEQIRAIGQQRREVKEALQVIREDAKRLVHKAVAGDSVGIQLAS